MSATRTFSNKYHTPLLSARNYAFHVAPSVSDGYLVVFLW